MNCMSNCIVKADESSGEAKLLEIAKAGAGWAWTGERTIKTQVDSSQTSSKEIDNVKVVKEILTKTTPEYDRVKRLFHFFHLTAAAASVLKFSCFTAPAKCVSLVFDFEEIQ